MNRRQFLKESAIVAAGVMAAGAGGCASSGESSSRRGAQLSVTTQPVGANGDIRVAVVGFNGQGKQHIKGYRGIPGVRIVALCDCDEQVLNSTADALERNDPALAPSTRSAAPAATRNTRDARIAPVARVGPVARHTDLRKLLDNKEIDVVSLAMPVRWHSLAAIWACQAGKDVYVEKPVSHCIWEGRQLVEAARRHGRVVQAGLNNRSRPELEEIFSFMRSGQLGKIVHVRAWDYKRRQSIGRVSGPQTIPAHVDYDLWSGPGPVLPLMRQRLHYDWHWNWSSGSGEIGNNGVHHLDMVRWALGNESSLPQTVISFGGRYGYVDDGQTPNTHVAVYDYDGVPVVYEARGLPAGLAAAVDRSRATTSRRTTTTTTTSPSESMDDFVGVTATGKPFRVKGKSGAFGGIAIVCEGGYCVDTTVYDNNGKVIKELRRQPVRPQQAFVRALRSRNMADLRPDILQGHLSTAVCHMGNISLQCGESMSLAKAAASADVRENVHAAAAIDRMMSHLAANRIDPRATTVTLGARLTMDSGAGTERFVGDGSERANWFIKDSYRAPFVVPDKV